MQGRSKVEYCIRAVANVWRQRSHGMWRAASCDRDVRPRRIRSTAPPAPAHDSLISLSDLGKYAPNCSTNQYSKKLSTTTDVNAILSRTRLTKYLYINLNNKKDNIKILCNDYKKWNLIMMNPNSKNTIMRITNN